MAKALIGLLRFENLRWFLPWLVAIVYLLPALVGMLKFQTSEAIGVLELLLVSLFTYLVAQRVLGEPTMLRQLVNRPGRFPADDGGLVFLVFGAYVLVALVAMLSASQIALLEALRGADPSDLEYYRELMFKAREGPAVALGYLNALLSVTLVPYAICILYWTGSRYRHLMLAVFVLLLLPSLEKALILRALVPLLFLFVNMKGAASSNRVLLITLASLGTIYALTALTLSRDFADVNPETSPYAMFDLSDPFQYVLNRIFWIPYITAYDYLRFFESQLAGEFLMGRSIGFVALLFGFDKVNIEREVFAFQWGQNEAGTGSANSAYFIDAFINFGMLGVIVYTLAIVAIVRLFMASDNVPAKAVFGYHCVFLVSSSLTGTLFSGGLLVLIAMAALLRPARRAADAEPAASAPPALETPARESPGPGAAPVAALPPPAGPPAERFDPPLVVDSLPALRGSRKAAPPRVTAAIVLYRHDPKMIAEVVRSVLADGAVDTLYLLDNANRPSDYRSLDGGRVKYVNCEANIGFGRAHNIAIRDVLVENVKYHVVINPDVLVQKGAVVALREAMERDPSIGLISPQLVNSDGTTQYMCKLLPTPYNLAVRRFGFRLLRELNDRTFTLRRSGYDRPMDVPSLPGAFMFMRCDVLREIGVFDERYFMYLEDLDLCRRIGRVARTVFYPGARVMHTHTRGSFASLRLLAHHIRSVFLYFGTYGWFWDRERREINAEVVTGVKQARHEQAWSRVRPDGLQETR